MPHQATHEVDRLSVATKGRSLRDSRRNDSHVLFQASPYSRRYLRESQAKELILRPLHGGDGNIGRLNLFGKTQAQRDFISWLNLSLRADSGAICRKIIDHAQVNSRVPQPTTRLAMRQGADKRSRDTDPRMLAKPIYEKGSTRGLHHKSAPTLVPGYIRTHVSQIEFRNRTD